MDNQVIKLEELQKCVHVELDKIIINNTIGLLEEIIHNIEDKNCSFIIYYLSNEKLIKETLKDLKDLEEEFDR